MIIGEDYTPSYNCAHGVATEYATIGVDLADTLDCDLFGVTFVRRMRKLFRPVETPRDWCLVVMTYGRDRHIGVMRYGRVKHNFGSGATGAVVSSDLRYIRRNYTSVTFWELNDQSNVLPDRRDGRELRSG